MTVANTRLASLKSAEIKVAVDRMARVSRADIKLVLVRLAPIRFASVKMAFEKLVPDRSACANIVRMKVPKLTSAFTKTSPVLSQPDQSTPGTGGLRHGDGGGKIPLTEAILLIRVKSVFLH